VEPTPPSQHVRSASRAALRQPLCTRSGIDVVTIIVGVNVLVFAYMITLGDAALLNFIEEGAISVDGLRNGKWWQPVTHLFLHGGDLSLGIHITHLSLNMLVIYMAGKELLLDVGTRHWLGLYLGSGILGGFFQILVTPGSPLLGASGAAFGLIAGLGCIHANERLDVWILGYQTHMYGGSFSQALLYSSGLLGIVALASSFTIPLISNMGHFAHFGGALGGLLYVKMTGLTPKTPTKASLEEERGLNDARLEAKRKSSHQMEA
jgi:membrane associated rhomboid family serine protease